ncbi:MAG: NADH-quinone oxidoreductase subunit M [Alphaproteobacteria bacterium]|nr:NADH-quinone oxidoreductase subunit M [Alphaproteobacteria bacterium]OJV45582.1 MAG: NADH-quinone oxidoreductase subunit M [Alphaproteobacteria bacterium 43-37]
MHGFPLLSLMIVLPLFGALFILLMRGENAVVERNAKRVALWVSLTNLLIALVTWGQFNPQLTDYQLVESYSWVQQFHTAFSLGLDGLSLPFVLLTTFLTPLCILMSWHSIEQKVKAYLLMFLLLEALVLGTFLATDLVVFYIFFEAVLIPMYFIIGIWGGERRVYAAFKFFLYTLAGSLLMLVAILAMTSEIGTTSMIDITGKTFSFEWQRWLWLAFFMSFAVKMPMWPVHTWLPDAHVEAPTSGSVILAGVLLKMGGYGFIRFLLPMFPDASLYFAPLVYTLSLIAAVYTALVAMVQEDIKKLIAYSSVAHMAFVTMGIFTFDINGLQGAMAQMISHGLISSALFLCVGVIYDRMHTREIAFYNGLALLMPRYAVLFVLFTMASVGLPGTSGFVAEFLVLLGSIQVSGWMTWLLALSMITGAVYMLYLTKRVIFGKSTNKKLLDMKDISLRESIILYPLAGLILVMGIYPSVVLKMSELKVVEILKPIKETSMRTIKQEGNE